MVKILVYAYSRAYWIPRISRGMAIRLVLISFILFLAGNCFAADLDGAKINFLKGNYSQVVSCGSTQGADELNYIIGLSYLKLKKTQNAKPYFEKAIQHSKGDLKEAADLGLADTFLMEGDLENARSVYKSMLVANGRTKLKAIICYRLSQLASREGNIQLAREYLNVVKSGFPLCLELKYDEKIIGAERRDSSVASLFQNDEEIRNGKEEFELRDGNKAGSVYTVQVGCFSSSYNASKLRDKLVSKGYSVFLEGASGVYRVRVGKFKNLRDAEGLESKLARDGFPTKVCSQ